jgi:hypothetical protein
MFLTINEKKTKIKSRSYDTLDLELNANLMNIHR